MEQTEWSEMNPTEKKKQLYLRQKDTLDKFLERNAITREDYEKSLEGLAEKMGVFENCENLRDKT